MNVYRSISMKTLVFIYFYALPSTPKTVIQKTEHSEELNSYK